MSPAAVHEPALIAFSWNGLPQYAARLIESAADRLGEPCIVVGSRPNVPVEGMERILGQSVYWLDAAEPTGWAELGLPIPRIFVQSGWSYPAFASLGREVKHAGGRVIGLCDANWRGDLRQLVLGPIAFRLRHRPHFDAMIVPGRQGERLMRYFGMASGRIRRGMYAADAAIFKAGPPLGCRPREFLFVGQFIPRKDVLRLANVFLEFSKTDPGWTLRLCGNGSLRDAIPASPQINVESFVQPEELASRFHAARFFVLPSLKEAWGLVVHEATLCGCALLLSDAIGSADDLANSTNAIVFKAGDDAALLRALHSAAACDAAWFEAAEHESLRLAAHFSPQRFAEEISALVAAFRSQG